MLKSLQQWRQCEDIDRSRLEIKIDVDFVKEEFV